MTAWQFRTRPILPVLLATAALAMPGTAVAQTATAPTPATTSPPAPAPAPAQAPTPADVDPFAAIPPANPADVASPQALVAALYQVISGDVGVKRDWNRFRSLFHPAARMMPTGKHPTTGKVRARIMTPEDYVRTSGPFLERIGFHEVELAHRIDQYGDIAHVFTTYSGRSTADPATPPIRGINSLQLMNDGTRWWVLNITWSQETPATPIPPQYLRNG